MSSFARRSQKGVGISSPQFSPRDQLSQLERSHYLEKLAFGLPLDQSDIDFPAHLPAELARFQRFLKLFTAKCLAPDFLDVYTEGDILEAYSLEHKQIYRSLDFFKFCSYDLNTMILGPWQRLFKRPEFVTRQMENLLGQLLNQCVPKLVHPVAAHMIEECFDGHNQAFLYEIKQVGCLVDDFTGELKGYASILKIQKWVAPDEPSNS